MKRFVPFSVVLSTVLCVGWASAQAEDEYAAPIYGVSSVDSYDQRMTSMETEMKSLSEKIANLGDDGYSSCGCYDCGCCNTCCNCYASGGLEIRAEALMMNYHRADGMRVGIEENEQINSSYNLAPRFTIGYRSSCGLGVRMRWFDYDHTEETVNDGDMKQRWRAEGRRGKRDQVEFLSVDTYNFDLELYDVICINDCWSLEISGGYRHNDFSEMMIDNMEGIAGFEGVDIRHNFGNAEGLVFGLEGRRTGCRGTLYFGFRGSVLMDNRNVVHIEDNVLVQQDRLSDVVQSIWEIGAGYERQWCLRNGALAYVRLGVEVQHWENFTSSFAPDSHRARLNDPFDGDRGNDNISLAGPSDVGFGGLTLGIGISR